MITPAVIIIVIITITVIIIAIMTERKGHKFAVNRITTRVRAQRILQ